MPGLTDPYVTLALPIDREYLKPLQRYKTHLRCVYVAAAGTIDRRRHFHQSEDVSMSTPEGPKSATSSDVAKTARIAQARLLSLRTIQIDELTTRYLDRGEVQNARALAAKGVDVSEACLRLMQKSCE
jgi:hypothetical protein